MFNAIKKHLEAKKENFDPSRRAFDKAIITGAAIGFAGTGMLYSSDAQAEYKIPGAISAQNKKFPGLGYAWQSFHQNSFIEAFKMSGREHAICLMGLDPRGYCSGGVNKEKAIMESYGYHLLARQIGVNIGLGNMRKIQSENPQLHWFDDGVIELYNHRNQNARQSFANGIFTAAKLTSDDYKRLQSDGVPLKWQGNEQDITQNALSLAQTFVSADLTTKEKILNIGIGEKENYDEEGVYWNLGGALFSEDLSKNRIYIQNQIKNQISLYKKLQQKLEFHTASNNLF